MALRRYLQKAVEKAGLNYGLKHKDGITFHSLRHSMASIALNAGIPEAVVQQLGNWKTRTMVSRYAHLADKTMRSAAAKLADLIDEGGQSNDEVKESKAVYKIQPSERKIA